MNEYFIIESKTEQLTFTQLYRFSSLFNSCKGCWTDNRDEAIRDGEAHGNLLQRYFNACACGMTAGLAQ